MTRSPLLRASAQRIGILFCLSILWSGSSAVAQRALDGPVWEAVRHPRLEARPTSGAIAVDGRLDDAGWQGVIRAHNFAEHEPGDQVRPAVDTEVMLTYDDEFLYAAFICYDDPSQVRATFTERDRIWNDDYVILMLDTFADQGWAYEISANPYGIQGDLLWSASSGEDMTYDLIYYSSGRITAQGWQVEMAIPWTSLRFPDRDRQEWRVDFWRNHPREVRGQYSWGKYDRDDPCWPCQWGTVTGIEGVRPGSGLEILPSYVASQAAARDTLGNFENGDLKGEPGVSLSYGISPTVTAEATVNPDFSQVESDAAQIDVNSTFALFFPEKRPFFQEGSDLWNTWFNAVYTRSINRPLWAAKATGRPGRSNFAVMLAQDDASPFTIPFAESSAIVAGGRSWSSLGRYQRTLGEQSHAGAIFTDRRHEGGGAGTTFGADTRLRLGQTTSLKFQILGTFTDEPDNPELTEDLVGETFDQGRHTSVFDGEEFWGRAIYAGFERSGRHWNLDLDYWERSATFRAENGFEPRNDQRQGNLWSGYTFFFGDGLIERISPGVFTGHIWNMADVKKDEWLGINSSIRLRWAQTFIRFQHIQSNELFGGIQFDHIFANELNLQLNPAEVVNGGLDYSYGHRIARGDLVMGKETNYGGWLNVKPLSRFLWENNFRYIRSDAVGSGERLFSGYVARSRLNLQLSREWSLRLVMQYNDFARSWDADPLLTWRLNPFSIFYIGSTRNYAEFSPDPDLQDQKWRLMHRTYFLKLQYLFQL